MSFSTVVISFSLTIFSNQLFNFAAKLVPTTTPISKIVSIVAAKSLRDHVPSHGNRKRPMVIFL